MAYRILLVDDEEIVLKTIYLELKERGYEVAMADSAEEALRNLKSHTFDLVITDLVMQGMSGLQLLEAIKKSHPHIMTLVLTGYGDWGSSLNTLRQHADDYLLKPCQTEEVIFRVERCLEKSEMQKKIARYEEKLGLRPKPVGSVNA